MITKDMASEEKLHVENFLSIRNATFSLSEVTAIIGPQASGKSVAAKFFYFFRSYIESLLTEAVMSNTDKRSFDKDQKDRFVELFHIEGYDESKFTVKYQYDDAEVIVSCQSGGKNLRIKTSESLSKLFAKMKRDYVKFDSERDDDDLRYATSDFDFFENYPIKIGNMADKPRTLLVPAARSFFSTIRSEVFSLLTAQKTLDPILVQFGRFYEISKRRFERSALARKGGRPQAEGFQERSRGILKGEYQRRDSKDWINMDWGPVELPNSSSGQQEALPLLMALQFYPSSFYNDQLLIIEEPEAHLFPSAQKDVVDLAVEVSKVASCRILFTTHSPYMLACLNNHIVRRRNIKDPGYINAYYMTEGGANSLFDREVGLIDYSALDEVSEKISDEFVRLLDE